MKRNFLIFLCGIALLCLITPFLDKIAFTKVNIINSSEYLPLNNLAQSLKKELSAANYHEIVDIYIGNFTDQPTIPEIKNKNHTNILLMGSRPDFDISQVQYFDFIFSTTYHLHAFLNDNLIQNNLLPIFFSRDESISFSPSDCVFNTKGPQCFLAVIGKQDSVISILDKENISYRVFDLSNREDIKNLLQQINLISGIITNYSVITPSIDIHGFFLQAIAHNIPILSDNVMQNDFINLNNFNLTSLFFDTLSYYTYESDIYDFLTCDSCRINKAEHANFLLNTLYTPKNAAKRIAAVLTQKSDIDSHETNVVSIITPLHAGLYNNGDYWVADDLAQSLEKYYKKAFLVYPRSILSYIGDVLIYFRGTIPLTETKIHPNTISLMYLAFPSTSETTIEEYVYSIKHEFSFVDGVVSASKRVVDEAKRMGYKIFYLPQFTNIRKFYPDYRPELATEVLFVGRNIYYRRAAQIVYDAGLPITIYGPGWNGLAISDYIDNRILRQYYSSAKIVLNDAKPDMRQLGFVINRIFDATA